MDIPRLDRTGESHMNGPLLTIIFRHLVRQMWIPSTIKYSRRRSSDPPIADERDQLFPRPSQQQPRRVRGSPPTKLEVRWPESQ